MCTLSQKVAWWRIGVSSAAYDGGMNKRSILTAVLALGLGVTALTGCNSNTGANYVTPSNVETITNTIAEIGDQGVKVPEKRDLKVVLPESDMAADYKVDISDPETLSAGKPDKNVITLHPLKVTVTEGAN